MLQKLYKTLILHKMKALLVVFLTSVVAMIGIPAMFGVGSGILLNTLWSLGAGAMIGTIIFAPILFQDFFKSKKRSELKVSSRKKRLKKLPTPPPLADKKHLLNSYEQSKKKAKQANLNKVHFISTHIDSNTISYALVDRSNHPITFSQALEHMQHDLKFREDLITIFKQCPYNAYFWECPPVNSKTVSSQNFEFVLIDAPQLACISLADPSPFSAHLKKAKAATHFENIGKDATLVIPSQLKGKHNSYQSLASFSRFAPIEQQHQFWEKVGKEAQQRIVKNGKQGTWISTSGLGVSWLHVRLDSFAKYINFKPYQKLRKSATVRP